MQASNKPKHRIPERKCVGCGEAKQKSDLIRVVRAPDLSVSLDRTGKKPGRGAYICPSAECLKKARKAHKLEKSFSCGISDEVYDALEAELRSNGQNS